MITSAQNKKIQEVRRLTAKRKEREAAGLYIAEGIRLVEEALPHAADCAYLLWSAPLTPRAEALIRAFEEAGVSVEEVTPQLMDSIAGTDSPQGVLPSHRDKRPQPGPGAHSRADAGGRRCDDREAHHAQPQDRRP